MNQLQSSDAGSIPAISTWWLTSSCPLRGKALLVNRVILPAGGRYTLNTMKRYLIFALLFLYACQALPVVTPIPTVASTRSLPSPVPASATPTQIPSPTRTATPPPLTFTEEFDAIPAYWSTLYASGQSGRAEVLERDGTLVYQLYQANTWVYALFGANEYQAVRLQTRFENQASELNYVGLLCSYDEQAGWFEFNLSSDGSYNLLFGQWIAPDMARYIPILNDTSEYIFTGRETNEMSLECFENTVQLYINDKLIRKMDVARFERIGGKIGLAVASFEDLPVIAAFDWVRVSSIDAPTP